MFYTDVKTRAQIAEYDEGLVWAAILLLGLGLVMVYSASIAIAEGSRVTGHQPTYYLVRHALTVAIGLAAAVAAFQVPLRLWQQAAPYLFVLGAALLTLVLIPGVGREVNGSQRWISLHVTTVQPSELMKLFAVLYAADYTARKAAHMASFRKGFLPMLVVMLVIGWLLLREPDFGAFVVITVIAMGILFVGATSAFAELKSSLDDIWHVPVPKTAGWQTLLRARLLSFSLVLVLAFMLLVSLIVNAALAVVERIWGQLWTQSWFAPVADVISTAFSFAVVTALFAVIFKMLPNARIAWRDVTMGAIITALLFSVGKRLIGLYLGNSAVASSYGAAGSVVALMLWIYYSAQIFFFGAELTRQYALQFGSLRGVPGMGGEGDGKGEGKPPAWPANR